MTTKSVLFADALTEKSMQSLTSIIIASLKRKDTDINLSLKKKKISFCSLIHSVIHSNTCWKILCSNFCENVSVNINDHETLQMKVECVLVKVDASTSLAHGHSVLPLRAYAVVGCDVNGVGGRVMAHGQAQVRDTTGSVLLHQNVLGL